MKNKTSSSTPVVCCDNQIKGNFWESVLLASGIKRLVILVSFLIIEAMKRLRRLP